MGNTGKPTLRELLSRNYDAVMGYGPVSASLVGAGAATNALVNGMKQKFQRGAAGLANLGGNQAEAERMRALAAQTAQEQAEASNLYQPMREAFPYATAIGEAAPAITTGVAGLSREAVYKVATTAAEEMAKRTRAQNLARALSGAGRF